MYKIVKNGDMYDAIIKDTKKKLFTSPSFLACNAYLTQICRLGGFRQVNTVNDPNNVEYEGETRYELDLTLSTENGSWIIIDNNCIFSSCIFEIYSDLDEIAHEDTKQVYQMLNFFNGHGDIFWEMHYFEMPF